MMLPSLIYDLTYTSKNNRLFQLVKRTGSSLKSKLVKTKQMALNKTRGRTVCCNKKNCQGCRIIADGDSVNINGILARPAGGSCVTYNIIYCFICLICTKGYVGRSVQQLNERVGQHRRNFYEMLRDINNALVNEMYRKDDEYTLGLHLVEDHCLCNRTDFENNYRVFILETCSPMNLEIMEHRFIHSLRTLKPHGLNAVDPFGIPLLKF